SPSHVDIVVHSVGRQHYSTTSCEDTNGHEAISVPAKTVKRYSRCDGYIAVTKPHTPGVDATKHTAHVFDIIRSVLTRVAHEAAGRKRHFPLMHMESSVRKQREVASNEKGGVHGRKI